MNSFYETFITEFPVPVSASPRDKMTTHNSRVRMFWSVKASSEAGLTRAEAWNQAKDDCRKTSASAVFWVLWFLWNSGLLSKMFSWLWNRRTEFTQEPIPEKPVDSGSLMG